MKKIMVDALKRYLPIIINALCATVCVSMAGCAVVGADTVNMEICPIKEKGLID